MPIGTKLRFLYRSAQPVLNAGAFSTDGAVPVGKRGFPTGTKGKYIATRQQSHSSSHVMPRRIFGDVDEREQDETKRSLFRETTAS